MRAMAIMYLNGSPIPYSVHDDIYLNPVMASNELLANFPPTFFLTGEKDPLVDDTVVFAARLRMAKMRRAKRMQGGYGTRRSYSGQHTIPRTAIDISDAEDEEEHYGIRVRILEGMSHAFFNMMAFLPEAAQATTLTSRWFKDLFEINISANVDNYKMDKNDVNISIPSAAGIEGAAPSAASKSTTTSTASTQSEASKLDTQLHVVSEQTLMQRRRNDLSSLHLT